MEECGNSDLEKLGFSLFYKGGNSDFYIHDNNNETFEVLQLRNDLISFPEFRVDFSIDGKGVLFNNISDIGMDFADACGIKTTRLPVLTNIPKYISEKSQSIKMFSPLKIKDRDRSEKVLKFAYYNHVSSDFYLTNFGMDLFVGNRKGIDSFDKPVFIPLSSRTNNILLDKFAIKKLYVNIEKSLNKLFMEFSRFAYGRGIVIFDTMFDVYVDDEGNWFVGSNIFTPETTRYVSLDGFNNNNYQPMDKQILFKYYDQISISDSFNSLFSPNKRIKLSGKVLDKPLNCLQEIYDLLS